MIITNQQIVKSNFYVNRLNSYEIVGKFNYFRFDYSRVKIEENKNILTFSFYLYFMGDYFLPADFFRLNINMPFASIENNPITLTNDYESTKDLSSMYSNYKIYKSNVIFNLNEVEWLQYSKNKKFEAILNLSVDTSSIGNNSNISAIDFQNFINEIFDQKTSIQCTYNNVFNLEESLNTYDYTNYFFDNIHVWKDIAHYYEFKFKNYTNTNNFYELLSIDKLVGTSYIVKNIKLELVYNYNNKTYTSYFDIPNLEKENEKLFTISLDGYEIYYDQNEKDYKLRKGDKGINFDFDTYGYYNISFEIETYKEIRYFKGKNTFSYIKSQYQDKTEIVNNTEPLKNYKELKNY